MNLSDKESKLAAFRTIPPEDRVLLLPHCLRRSAHCRARYTRESGLQCEICREDCPIGRILRITRERGFKGICVAPGGSMALEFLKRTRPKGILAVACPKELVMGIDAVVDLSRNGWNPAVVTLDLERDGCVDTEVDVDLVLEFVRA